MPCFSFILPFLSFYSGNTAQSLCERCEVRFCTKHLCVLCAVLPLYYIVIISYRKDDLFLFFSLLHTSPHRYLYERHNFSERIIRLFFITAIDKYDIWGYNIDVLINSTDLTKTLRRVKIRALSVDRTGSCRSDEKHRCLRFVFCIPLHKT